MLKIAAAFALLLVGRIAEAQQWRELYEPRMFDGMPVRAMKPIDFDPSERYPVIVSLHGAGGKGTDNHKQLKDWNRQLAESQRRKDFPCYVVAPQAAELWDADDHTIKPHTLLRTTFFLCAFHILDLTNNHLAARWSTVGIVR